MAFVKNITLKEINLRKSHANQASISKSNFKEIGNYINDNRGRIKVLEDNNGSTTEVTNTQIKNAIRTEMIKTVELKTSHVDGTTIETNGVSVTRSSNKFIVQTPDSISVMFHSLRVKSSKVYASALDIRMDASNQIIVEFSPFIKEDLEFTIFG